MRYVILIIFSAIIFSCSSSKQTTTTANQPKAQTETVSNDIIATQQLASVVSNLGTNSQNQRFGAYLTTGNPTQAQIDAFRGFCRGLRVRDDPATMNPSNNVYNFSVIDNAVNLCVKNKIGLGYQLWRNPLAQLPAFYNSQFNVPIVTTQGGSISTYDYYLDTAFLRLSDSCSSKLSQHISTYTTQQKQVFDFLLGSFGVTGDYGAYKGTPTNSKYNIPDNTWDNYFHTQALNFKARNNKLNQWLPLSINPDNAAQQWDWAIANNFTWLKVGELGHGYAQQGEGTYLKRCISFMQQFPDGGLYSESEGIQNDTSWHEANMFPMIGQCLTAKMKVISVQSTDNVIDVSLAFLNKYAGSPVGGFSMMRDVLDYADTVRFSQSKYGALIDPTRVNQYNAQVQKVLKDTTMGNAAKQEKLSSLLANYIYEQRVAAIQFEYTQKGYIFNPNSQYYNDGGVDLWGGNYEVRLHLSNPNDAPAIQRTGSKDSAFGRYGRVLTKTGLFFDLSADYLLGDTTTISITYLDNKPNFQYAIKYSDGTLTRITPFQKAKNTGTWVTDNITIPHLKQTGLYGHTFSLYAITGNTVLSVIEIK